MPSIRNASPNGQRPKGLTDDADLVKIAATLKADFLVIIKFDELGCRADGERNGFVVTRAEH